MAQIAITKAITTLEEAETRFNLVRTTDPKFFMEWWQDLPELSESEKVTLDRIRGRYRYQRSKGHLAEGVVNLVVVARLLELAGFYDPPLRLRSEVAVTLAIDPSASSQPENQELRGRLDFLVIHNKLWITVLESKATEINLEEAIPQTLAYMYSDSAQTITYGLATNGGQFFFLKLKRNSVSEYDLSDVFSLMPLQNRLYEVLQVLKRLGHSFALDARKISKI